MTERVDAALVPTPVGELAVLVHGEAVVAAGFAPVEAHYARLRDAPPLRRVRRIEGVMSALAAYVDGDLAALDPLPAHQPGGPFQQAAWAAMRAIPAGETVTYRELAELVGSPLAVRAAGTACARNLIAPIVPCHRVVRTGGALGGYYYGLSTKEWLQAHERAHAPARSAGAGTGPAAGGQPRPIRPTSSSTSSASRIASARVS